MVPGIRDTTGNMTQSCGAYTLLWKTDNYNVAREMRFSKVQGQWNQTKILFTPGMGKGNSQRRFFGRRAVSTMI